MLQPHRDQDGQVNYLCDKPQLYTISSHHQRPTCQYTKTLVFSLVVMLDMIKVHESMLCAVLDATAMSFKDCGLRTNLCYLFQVRNRNPATSFYEWAFVIQF